MENFKKWFKNPFGLVAIFAAILSGLTFVYFVIPGFSTTPNSTKNLKVEIVDKDKSEVSGTISKSMQKKLPFKHVAIKHTMGNSKQKLSNRDTALVMEIPKGFSNQLEKGKTPTIHYYVSESNPILQNMANRSSITAATTAINSSLTSAKTTQALAKTMAPAVAKEYQEKNQAKMAEQIAKDPTKAKDVQNKAKKDIAKQTAAAALVSAKRMTMNTKTNVTHLNSITKDNYQYQMAPLFTCIGSYLGMMLMAIVLVLTFMSARFAMGKWAAFAAAQFTGIVGALIVPFTSVTALHTIINFSTTVYWNLIGTQMAYCLASFELTFMLALLMAGLPSTIVQVPLFASQIIASGGILPRAVMPEAYKQLSYHSPMYSGVYQTFNSLYGGGNSSIFFNNLGSMVVFGIVATVVIIAVGYRAEKIEDGHIMSNLLPFNDTATSK